MATDGRLVALYRSIDDFCMAKNPPKGEFRRQVIISQIGLDWAKIFCSETQLARIGGRLQPVLTENHGSVKDYATAMRTKWHRVCS